MALSLAFVASLAGCAACTSPPASVSGPRLPPPASAFRGRASAILAGMDLEAKCGQVLLIGVPGRGNPSAEAKALVKGLGPGGILLFGFNVGDRAEDLGLLTGGLQDAAKDSAASLPLIVAIDHEGGSVFRFKGGVTHLPSPAVVGERGQSYAGLLGRRAGLELSALGVNLALAPVVELRTQANSGFLGERSYGSQAARVDAVAGAFIEGLESAGVAAAAKHFPGNAGVDPHQGLPVLAAGKETLERDYVERFRAAMDHGAAVVLLSHVLVPALDPERPATTSALITDAVLKKGLRFDGVALTDDLFMRALSATSPPTRSAVEALASGADLLMLSEGRAGPGVRNAIMAAVKSGVLPAARLDDAVLRIIELKLRFGMAVAFDKEARAGRLASLQGIVEESRKLLEAAAAK